MLTKCHVQETQILSALGLTVENKARKDVRVTVWPWAIGGPTDGNKASAPGLVEAGMKCLTFSGGRADTC